MKKQFRQGDVLIEAIESIPTKANKVTSKMLAKGEHSNHGHMICGDVEVLEKDGNLFIDVQDATLKHLLINSFQSGTETWTQEHTEIKLPAGKYKVIQQVEYDPYEQIIRQVQD